MGLDIFFYKAKRGALAEHEKAVEDYWNNLGLDPDTYNNAEEWENLSEEKKTALIEAYRDQPGFDPEDIGYFRKVNLLMAFFGYEGNCQYLPIDRDKLAELAERCGKVLQDKERAGQLLPTESGFFFGSTDYDEDYFDGVRAVRKWAEDTYANTTDNDEILMYAWW